MAISKLSDRLFTFPALSHWAGTKKTCRGAYFWLNSWCLFNVLVILLTFTNILWIFAEAQLRKSTTILLVVGVLTFLGYFCYNRQVKRGVLFE